MPGKDFTRKREPVWFTINEYRYDCYPSLVLDDLKALRQVVKSGITEEDAVEKIEQVFEIIMEPESYATYIEVKKDRKNAWDHEQLRDVLEWMLETYAGRPTESPSNSANGSPSGDTGSGSTAGASVEVSIPSDSMRNVL